MTTPAYRLLGSGRRRRLGDGRVRSVGAPMPRYTEIGGSAGMGVGAGGRSTAWVPLAGEGALRFALAAELDSAGVFGSTALSVALAGQLSAPVNLVAAAALGFATAARLTAAVPMAGAIPVSVQIAGELTGAASLAGATGIRIQIQARIGSPTGIAGVAGVGFGVTGTLSTAAGGRWRDLWREVYDTRQALLNAIDANNRYLAQQAGSAAQAAADAVVVTNTKVTELEDGLEAEASRITALTTRVTNTETTNTAQGSAISALQTTTTSQGTTLTSHSTQLTGLSASITTLDGRVTNVANATELLEVEVDSLGAAKAIKGLYLNVNGYIGGYQSINDGTVAQFNVMADVFRLLSPGATNGLEVQNGYVRSWRAGSQVIIGNGFGASGDLMFYAGPNVGAGNASKANATMWVDAVGSAYFGGSLSAGVLKNAAQSSQIGASAQVETGQFGTNGNSKVVVYSLSYANTGWSASNPGAGTTSATIVLERSIGGGAWTQVGSVNLAGNRTVGPNEPGSGYPVTVTLGGSATFTDTNTSMSNFNYRVRITANSGWPYIIVGGFEQQRLAVVSTEE